MSLMWHGVCTQLKQLVVNSALFSCRQVLVCWQACEDIRSGHGKCQLGDVTIGGHFQVTVWLE